MTRLSYDIAGSWDRLKSKAGDWHSNEQRAIAQEVDRLRDLLRVMQEQLTSAEDALRQAESRIVELRATCAAFRDLLIPGGQTRMLGGDEPRANGAIREKPEAAHELLTTREAAEFLGVSQPTMNRWRAQGDGPMYVKFGRAVRYDHQTLIDWVESRVRKSTNDPGRSV